MAYIAYGNKTIYFEFNVGERMTEVTKPFENYYKKK